MTPEQEKRIRETNGRIIVRTNMRDDMDLLLAEIDRLRAELAAKEQEIARLEETNKTGAAWAFQQIDKLKAELAEAKLCNDNANEQLTQLRSHNLALAARAERAEAEAAKAWDSASDRLDLCRKSAAENAELRQQLEEARSKPSADDVLRIRCMEHRDVPQVNSNAHGAECGACLPLVNLEEAVEQAKRNLDPDKLKAALQQIEDSKRIHPSTWFIELGAKISTTEQQLEEARKALEWIGNHSTDVYVADCAKNALEKLERMYGEGAK